MNSPDDILQIASQISPLAVTQLCCSDWIDQWPSDPAYYLALTRSLWTDRIPMASERPRHAGQILQEIGVRQNVELIFCHLMHRDECTAEALLEIAVQAFRWPDAYGANGVNALATIANVLWESDSVFPPKALLSLMQKFRDSPLLRHNATNCLNAILRRHPNLTEEGESQE